MKHKSVWSIIAVLVSLAAVAETVIPENLKEFDKGVKEVLPAVREYRAETPFRYLLIDGEGNPAGKLYLENTDKYRRIEGYNGVIETGVVTDLGDRIISVVPGPNKETPSFMRRLVTAKFYQNWTGLNWADAKKKEVNAVTRATYSSNAIIQGVKNVADTALDAAKPE